MKIKLFSILFFCITYQGYAQGNYSMVALYESLLYPFVVLFSIPVAIIGALLALALTMNNLTTFSLCGLIMLLGLVAKNGILIVDFANHLKSKGLPLTQVLVEAG